MLTKQLEELAKETDGREKTLPTLIKIIKTITKSPAESKYRQLKQSNAGVKRCLARGTSFLNILLDTGFSESVLHNEKYLVMAIVPSSKRVEALAARVVAMEEFETACQGREDAEKRKLRQQRALQAKAKKDERTRSKMLFKEQEQKKKERKERKARAVRTGDRDSSRLVNIKRLKESNDDGGNSPMDISTTAGKPAGRAVSAGRGPIPEETATPEELNEQYRGAILNSGGEIVRAVEGLKQMSTYRYEEGGAGASGKGKGKDKGRGGASANASNVGTRMKRVAKELRKLGAGSDAMPVHRSSTIAICHDEDEPHYMRALITGPDDTPYASGVFEFDIYLPPSYPAVPPKVTLLTTGNGTIHFSPNLYPCGKVCLSILGTWPGQGVAEEWNEKISSVYQVRRVLCVLCELRVLRVHATHMLSIHCAGSSEHPGADIRRQTPMV
jgi:ubiquitin-protein ligase